jgi:hypothetical protein
MIFVVKLCFLCALLFSGLCLLRYFGESNLLVSGIIF